MTSELPSHDVLDPDDVADFFLAALPFLALPGPPRPLALPAPRMAAHGLARVTTVALQAQAPSPAPAAAAAPTAAPSAAVAPATAAAAEPAEELTPSPWDAGFDPPKSAASYRPEPQGPDPRTLSRNRPRRPTNTGMPASQTAAPAPIPKPKAPQADLLHDLVILPQNPAFKAADQGVQAVLNYLRTAQMLMPRVRHDTAEGTIIELTPDVFVHQVFLQGQAPAGAPAIREATLRVSPTPRAPAFGPAGRASCFALELVGCRFPMVQEAFKARLHQIVYLRPEVFAVPHDPQRLRATDPAPPQPIPAFDMQEVDRS